MMLQVLLRTALFSLALQLSFNKSYIIFWNLLMNYWWIYLLNMLVTISLLWLIVARRDSSFGKVWCPSYWSSRTCNSSIKDWSSIFVVIYRNGWSIWLGAQVQTLFPCFCLFLGFFFYNYSCVAAIVLV